MGGCFAVRVRVRGLGIWDHLKKCESQAIRDDPNFILRLDFYITGAYQQDDTALSVVKTDVD